MRNHHFYYSEKKIQIWYLLRYTKIILSLYSFNLYVEMNAWKQVPRRSFSMIFVLLVTISSSFQPHVHPLIPIVPLIKQCKPNKQPKNGHKTKLLLIFRYQKQERSTCHLNVWWPTILDQRLEKKRKLINSCAISLKLTRIWHHKLYYICHNLFEIT